MAKRLLRLQTFYQLICGYNYELTLMANNQRLTVFSCLIFIKEDIGNMISRKFVIVQSLGSHVGMQSNRHVVIVT